MAVVHAGNMANTLAFEEHDGANNAKRVSIIGNAGQATVTMQGLVTLAPSPNFIGLVTVAGIGTLTLSDPKGYIGLTTTTLGAGDRFIGLATVVHAGNVTLNASAAFIGIVTVAGIGTLTLADPKGYIGLSTVTNGVGDRFIGLVTTVMGSNVTLNASAAFIGLVTVAGIGTLTLADPKGFIGLVSVQGTVGVLGNTTVLTRNAGTNKVLKSLPVAFATSSAATVFVPSNTFYITQVLLNSNATVRLNIRSGATHLTGNASLGVNIFPGGGWVENGSPDSPLYIGLAAAAPIVIEKADAGGIISQIGGHITYFDE